MDLKLITCHLGGHQRTGTKSLLGGYRNYHIRANIHFMVLSEIPMRMEGKF